ncbi:MAG: hypothetical protein IJ793_02730 [Opitutales bacterium]|nr:hypothetical protein [Opitutales bacterium]
MRICFFTDRDTDKLFWNACGTAMPSEERFGEGLEAVLERTVPRDGVHCEMYTAFCPHCLGRRTVPAQHPPLTSVPENCKSPETEYKQCKDRFHKGHATIR